MSLFVFCTVKSCNSHTKTNEIKTKKKNIKKTQKKCAVFYKCYIHIHIYTYSIYIYIYIYYFLQLLLHNLKQQQNQIKHKEKVIVNFVHSKFCFLYNKWNNKQHIYQITKISIIYGMCICMYMYTYMYIYKPKNKTKIISFQNYKKTNGNILLNK